MPSVLVADDEASIRLLVRACIASGDYDVVEAADGDQAWEVIRARRPGLRDIQSANCWSRNVPLKSKRRCTGWRGRSRITRLSA